MICEALPSDHAMNDQGLPNLKNTCISSRLFSESDQSAGADPGLQGDTGASNTLSPRTASPQTLVGQKACVGMTWCPTGPVRSPMCCRKCVGTPWANRRA